MGPSEKAFNQVKSILGKLDRSIDQLREQRTTPPAPAAAVVTHARVEPPKPAPAPAPAPYRSASGFGRATPITPTNN
ncbi:MAG TPA: hypothetical protein VD997_06610 [Phycisphaerales bacterium]|nr:hypothetical protein [Phycisphaerales bacterium]